ncbi:MAG: homocysteine S-methyltransferase family protein [Phycisphaeraceae bacterium]|nr:homocysteine S-methyltransferase family protein [Phycisphaeraceae bacterium]
MTSPFLKALSSRILVFDGAMGTSIHQRDLSLEKDYLGRENCTDILVKTRPDVIQEIHESFLAVGADCVETDTFGSNELVLAEFDLVSETRSLNRTAAQVARAACERHTTGDKPRFAVGSMGPGTRLITLGNTDWDAMFRSYREQALGLIEGGVDAFVIETCQDLLQVKCAINAVLAALDEKGRSPLDIPIMVSVTIETTGTMLLGTEIAAAAHALAEYPIASLGLNCATGPTEMSEHIHFLGHHWPCMGGCGSHTPLSGVDVSSRLAALRRAMGGGRVVSVMPNAGLPLLVEGRTEYPLGAEPFAQAVRRFIEADGVRIVGGCCGTTPEHIRRLADVVAEIEHRPSRGPVATSAPAPAVTSLYSPEEYRQDNSILIVGERMNASGSRAFKRLLEAEDWDGIVSLAREQVRHEGAHVLDLNVDYAGRDNARDMAEVVRRVVRQVNVPLMLDSTQPRTIEAGLRHAPGKCIINSANFEDGEEKFDQVCMLAKGYGAALVIGSIDEDKEASMARTADRKLSIARRAFRRAIEKHGMAPHDLLFDPLVLPISTGMESDRRSALETIEGVRLISRELPECQTTVGLSNVSFGLRPAARVVLNSVFLHELREAGLTSAILHFSKILPRNRIPDGQWSAALDLIYDRRTAGGPDPLQTFIALFKDEEAGGASAVKVKAAQTLEERLRSHIIDGEKEGIRATLDEAMTKYTPLSIINDHLLDGMKTVGELFGSGQMQLPFVLQSAEVMKMAVTHLEPHMERVQGQSKGRIVLATVKGDVHDIGKNLVDIILSNNGYTVYNIGIKQTLAEMVKAFKEHDAHAIGMSGLLVKSVNVMEENLRELNASGLTPPVILGGAALTRHYCEGHLRGVYDGACYYGRDAFDGLRLMDMLMSGRAAELDEEISQRQQKRSRAEETINQSRVERLAQANREGVRVESGAARSDIEPVETPPTPPFLGSRVVHEIPLDSIYPFINTTALFRGQWQVKKGAQTDAQYAALIEDTVLPVFEALKARCRDDGILRPAAVYGYFPCNAQGEDLIVWDPDAPGRRELERFTFPRQADKRRLCISDYFLPVEAGRPDVLGLHCVTMGHEASRAAKALFEANDYTRYLYLHGLGVETAEALAEYWHKRMRQELGIASEDSPRIRDLFTQQYRGSRYSFGYPACPNMADQEKLFRLLDPGRIGCVLTENHQIDPEQSTSAIIVHHPAAKYFGL